MRQWMFLFVLFAALTCSSTSSQAQGYSLERFSIKLSLPKGYCAIDPSHTDDTPIHKYLQDLQQKASADGGQVVASATECAQLEAWRKPSLQTDFILYHVAAVWKYESATHEARVGLPAALCKLTRQKAGQATSERVLAVLRTVKAGEQKMVGVIDEEPGACYVLVVERVQLGTGEPASGLLVAATATIKGRVLRFFHYTLMHAGKEIAALHRSAELLKETVGANLAANR